MKIIEYESASWRIIVPSNEGYELSDVKNFFAKQGVRRGLVNTIERHPSGFVADAWRQVRWHKEFRDGIRTLVIDLYRRLKRR